MRLMRLPSSLQKHLRAVPLGRASFDSRYAICSPSTSSFRPFASQSYPQPTPTRGDTTETASEHALPTVKDVASTTTRSVRSTGKTSMLTKTTRASVKKTKLSIKDLPPSLVPLEPLPLEDGGSAYPTVVRQARSNMTKFENCVLLTRVGGFYELYFEQADEYGPLLNLKVAQKKTNAGLVSMAGFPFFQLDRYLRILVQDHNRYVAVAEEFPNNPSDKVKSGGLMHDRKVSRIITPGTLIDEDFMDPFSNNYVLAIHINDVITQVTGFGSGNIQPTCIIGLAWLDLSTGHFFTQSSPLLALPSFLSRIGPREIVLDEDFRIHKDHGIFTTLEEDHQLVSYVNVPEEGKLIATWAERLESPISTKKIAEFTQEEIAAGSTLLQYVETRLRGSQMKIQPPVRQHNVMGIDKSTMRALEIKTTMRDGRFAGSLLHSIRRTVTQGGARLLDSSLTSPSTSIDVINFRLDLVTHMLNNETLRDRIFVLLRRSHDSHRLLQKFAFGRGDPDDLLELASTISATQELRNTLVDNVSQNNCVQSLVNRLKLDGPGTLAARIKDAIDEQGVVQQHQIEDGEAEEMQALAQEIVVSEGSRADLNILPKGNRKKKATSIRDHYSDENETWIMKPAASPRLAQLHLDLTALSSKKHVLNSDLCDRLGLSSLSLRFSPGLGHICHVKGKDINVNIADVKSVGSSKSTRSFQHPEWTNLGESIDQCRTNIRSEEQRVFNLLRRLVITHIIQLRQNAAVLDELDVACSFAALAADKGWTRPILNHSTKHNIVGGRHPTVEGGLEEEGRSFIRNDCSVGNAQQTWLITGPNMAGKSTFLRQNALITVLAQVGSYVPAHYAELGIVDQIFSRVGSADNLYRDQSTFMVEMLETAMILKNATARSFVIMDEIGRGTTPEDGTAVAFACLHHLYHINKSRTLFATHFHSLADIIKKEKMAGVGFYCTDVEESKSGDGFRYVHKLRQGINRQSHALKVARLAGLPEKAITVARELLQGWEESVQYDQ